MKYIIIRGPLAVGKSSVAQMLASEIGAEYISIDQIIDDYELDKEKEDGYISQNSFLKVNELVVPLAKKFVEGGRAVVFDGNFYWKSVIEDLISKIGDDCRVFTLKAPVEVCIERDKERGETHGEAAARVVHSKVSQFDYGEVVETGGKTAEDVVKEIREKLV